MFGENIIPDDMLDGFYNKNPLINISNKIDFSNNLVDPSNNSVQTKNVSNNKKYNFTKNILLGIMCMIRPIDNKGDMKKK